MKFLILFIKSLSNLITNVQSPTFADRYVAKNRKAWEKEDWTDVYLA